MNVKSAAELHFATLQTMLEEHSDIISFEIKRKRVGDQTGFIEIIAVLIQNRRVEIFEFFRTHTVQTYRYHFMTITLLV